MAIVKYKDSRNGRIYVYESKGGWDLETQTIINTTRTKKSDEKGKLKHEKGARPDTRAVGGLLSTRKCPMSHTP